MENKKNSTKTNSMTEESISIAKYKSKNSKTLFFLLSSSVFFLLINETIQEFPGKSLRFLAEGHSESTIDISHNNTNPNLTLPIAVQHCNDTRLFKKIPHAQMIENITALFRCSSNADCSDNGLCDLERRVCECSSEYATHLDNFCEIVGTGNDTISLPSDLKMCNYSKKKQLTAFMLSLFVGFGSDHFYMDRNDFGIAKLVFYCACCVGNIVLFIIYMWFPEKIHLIDFLGQYEALYMGCGFIVAILWIIYDLIMIGNLSHFDGKGIPLQEW